MSQGILHRSFLLQLFCFLCLGCAETSLTSRVIVQESSSFVRLDSYQIAGGSSVRYEHPAKWTEEELNAILGRLLLEDRVGLMDRRPAPRAAFTSDDLAFLLPAIRRSFEQATPQEWVAFCILRPHDSGYAVTSGGMFVESGRLHIVLANHQAAVGNDSAELSRVRANPFYSVEGTGWALTFESSRFITGVQANWSGGNKSSASELILDHQSFLAVVKQTAVPPIPPRPVEPSVLDATRATVVTPSRPPAASDADLQQAIRRLQDEVAQLKRKVEEQEAEITRLKRGRTPSSNHPPGP